MNLQKFIEIKGPQLAYYVAAFLRKEIPCDLVYEDDLVLFFKDINPQAKIHILGIPKMKVANFNEFVSTAESKTIKHFFSKAYEVIKKLEIDITGFGLITNNGQDANQEVPHFHIHILAGENLKGLR